MINTGSTLFYTLSVLKALFQGREIQTEADQGPDAEAGWQKPSIKLPLHQSLPLVPAILWFLAVQ